MANLPELSQWDSVYQIETTDQVMGGALGASNTPLKNLTNRTKFLADSKAPLASPGFTGTPTAPTATAGTNTTQLATTAFVGTAVGAIPAASEATQGKVELATAAETATGTDAARAVHPAGLKPLLDAKAPLASPTFTGTPTAPTASAGTSTTQLATTAFVGAAVGAIPAASESAPGKVELATAAETATGTDVSRAVHPAGLKPLLDAKAPLSSPGFTGTPTAPTASAGTSTTQLATTAFVGAAISGLIDAAPGALDTLNELAAALGDDPNFATTLTTALVAKAPLASPALTGTPTAPTATAGTSTTQLATTAFVGAAVSGIPVASETTQGKVELATAAETATGTDAARAVTPAGVASAIASKLNAGGAAPLYACRAWVNFSGTTMVIRGAGNVSSITDLGVGNYRVNFTTPMPDGNYVATGVSSAGANGATAISGVTQSSADIAYDANSFTFFTCDTTGNDAKDPTFVFMAFFR